MRYTALGIVLTLLALAVFEVTSGRYQIRPVLSGSMRPGLPTGGVVVTKRVPVSSLQVRDVIVFHRPDNPAELVVHRIVTLQRTSAGIVIQTQGDDNRVRDPWKVTLRGTTAYRAEFALPYVGYVAVWMHNPAGRRLLLEFGIAILIAAAMAAVWSRHRRQGSRTPPEDEPGDPDDAAAEESAEPTPGCDVVAIPLER
jgi:signal peptidase